MLERRSSEAECTRRDSGDERARDSYKAKYNSRFNQGNFEAGNEETPGRASGGASRLDDRPRQGSESRASENKLRGYDMSGLLEPGSVRETNRVQRFWNEQSEWSQATFGTDQERGPLGALKHLEKEAREAQEYPIDWVEIADCQFLVFDAARRAGMTLDQLMNTCEQKLIINKARKWGKPTSDEPVEHIR